MTLNLRTADLARRHLGSGEPDTGALNRALRQLAKWRGYLIVSTFLRHHGPAVLNGPFKGLIYTDYASEGALPPRLLGTYESELHPAIERLAAAELDVIVDIGCAEGYYAVGLARFMPTVEVHAFDIDEQARTSCRNLAIRNGVLDRVHIGGAFGISDFASYAGRRVLVWIDAEGFEDEVLRPDLAPALKDMHLIVETHPSYKPGVVERLSERFSSTHDIEIIHQQPKTMPLPQWLMDLGHLDQLIAVWEFRGRPTPWMVMTPRSLASPA